jgi:putative redox protein
MKTKGEVHISIARENYRTEITAGGHHLQADEPMDAGGTDSGPTPYGFLASALGACTAITLRMYAERKEWDLQGVDVRVIHSKPEGIHGGDRFERVITLRGNLDADQRKRLLAIAQRSPVHRTLDPIIELPVSLAV